MTTEHAVFTCCANTKLEVKSDPSSTLRCVYL